MQTTSDEVLIGRIAGGDRLAMQVLFARHEVAGIVGIPEATVKTRMFYARKKLSELLKEQGIDRGWP